MNDNPYRKTDALIALIFVVSVIGLLGGYL
jgi:hypothetical protein